MIYTAAEVAGLSLLCVLFLHYNGTDDIIHLIINSYSFKRRVLVESRFYLLCDHVALRGWNDLPCALYDSRARRVLIGNRAKTEAALACNGKTDFSNILLPDYFREYAEELVSRGLARPCREGEAFSTFQQFQKYPAPFLKNVHWEITGHCNFRCRHCYMSAPGNHLPHLSSASVFHIIDELASCGVFNVALTGGEPLVRSDFPQIVEALSEKGINIDHILSNGALIDEKLLDLLERCGQHPVLYLSYDGTDGWHDWMRGVSGAGDMAERAIKLWRSRGLEVWVHASVHKGNIGTIRDIVNHMAKLDVTKLRFAPVKNEGEWLLHSDGNELSYSAFFEAVLSYLPFYFEDGMPIHLILADIVELDPDAPDIYILSMLWDHMKSFDGMFLGCRSGMIEITCSGKVRLCGELGDDYLEMPPLACDDPDIRTASLSEILGGPVYRRTMALTCHSYLDKHSPCSSCERFSYCHGGCRGHALKEGSLFGRSSLNCQIFLEERWPERTFEVMSRIRPDMKPVPFPDFLKDEYNRKP